MFTSKLEIQASEINQDIVEGFRKGKHALIVIRNADETTVSKFGELLPQDMYGKTAVTIGYDDKDGDRLNHTTEMMWHQDRAYHKDVHPYVGLFCLRADPGSSKTYFVNMQQVFENSPTDLQESARQQRCVNSITKYMKQEEYPYKFKSPAHQRAYRMANRTMHPLVWNDEYGEYYFFSKAYTETDLEDRLQEQVNNTRSYIHDWQCGDLLVYNNYKVVHCREATDINVIRQHVRYALK